MAKTLYKNTEALIPIQKIVTEAGAAVSDKARTIKTSDIPEVLGAVAGIGVGGAAGFGLLTILGVSGLSAAGITSGLATAGAVIGGGMVAGIGVLAAPAVILGVGGYALLSSNKKKRLVQTKEMLLQEALKKHDAIIRELKNNLNQTQERLEYLNTLNILLQGAIKDLKADLAQ
ncbi:hypothetical protein A8L34_23140 [Bacillus sp. FJAT-27264]|uniref:hypothetical protein n=1 Tax=Paenibacillus sp. (strain DSM 101736 / FJAT-27264) TaxID=1850362 RepID=UPI000807C977|nr:hypothetical protein [Bacillus sp. FJAT-27264]OBZ09044.1 hypothetical protein A8L34_23140 [Bacillus sp. FJAT-27264]